MEGIITSFEDKGFDLIYHETKIDDYQSITNSYMIWMKNRKYFIFECSMEAIKDFTKHGIELNLNLWLKDLEWDDLQKLIDLGLPGIKSTIRETKLRKLLGK